jgi:uracil-DNA glycosylase
MIFTLEEVHASWRPFFAPLVETINSILKQLEDEEVAPPRQLIFRAFQSDLDDVRVVIFGQDPYPGPGVAHGLAFSVQPEVPIPASLKNIFKEYSTDLGYEVPTHGDLSAWSSNGVLLLNRALTTVTGERDTHKNLGWSSITEPLAEYLGARGVAAILWGATAGELDKYFSISIKTAHPSPLSAYRGFFGSKPFTSINSLLEANSIRPIDWKL